MTTSVNATLQRRLSLRRRILLSPALRQRSRRKFEDAQNRYTHLLDVYLDAISAVRKVALLQHGDVNGSAENSDPA